MATLGVNTTEAEFRSWLGGVFNRVKWFYTNIETSTKAGIPDMYVVAEAVPFWLELKVDTTTSPLIRKEQRVWGFLHARAGGRSYFLYYCRATDRCLLYANPVVEVKKVGRYLQIIDFPIKTFHPEDLIVVLSDILFD